MVHIDIVFKTARFGHEAEAPVRFKLSLRAAEVAFVIPPNEPLKIIQDSVARDQALKGGKLSRSTNLTKGSSRAAHAAASLGASPKAGASAAASTGTSHAEERTFKTEDEVRLILSTHRKASDGSHLWELVPASASSLQGQCWDAVREPRLSVRDTRVQERQMEGICRVEVRCKREDLLVEDITLKDAGLLKRLATDNFYHNRIAAAEAYIRRALTYRGLDHGDLDELFSDISVAMVTVDPEVV